MADHLVLSPETVRTHVKNIMRKLDVSTREEAVVAHARDARRLTAARLRAYAAGSVK